MSFKFTTPGAGPKSLPASNKEAQQGVVEQVQAETTKPAAKASNKPRKPKAAAKTSNNTGSTARTKPIKFYVTPEEEQRFVEMLDGRSASKFLHKKFLELMS